MSVLNGFHPSIQFTYETEPNNRLSFLDVLIIRNGQRIETCVYGKPTNTDIYILWNFLHQSSGNAAPYKNFSLSFVIDILNDHYLTLELKYLRNVLMNTTTIHTGSSHRFLMMSIKYLTNNKD